MDMNTVGARVIWARTQKGWNSTQLIEQSGVPQGTISKLERGDQSALGKHGPRIADATGVRLDWLATGKGDQYELKDSVSFPSSSVKYTESASDSDVLINQYRDIRWAAGNSVINDNPGDYDALAFKRSYLERNSLKPDFCIACPISGDSMSPTINDGDTVLINLEEQNLFAKDGNIFAFAFGEDCRIKRVYTTITGEVRLVSDNPNKGDYPDELIKPADLSLLNVAGRVRWSGGDK